MNINAKEFDLSLESFNPQDNIAIRTQSLFSASLVFASSDLITRAYQITQRQEIETTKIYELLLQSYLFLGFPRTLIAFDILDSYLKESVSVKRELEIAGDELKKWHKDGLKICRKVYGGSFQKLKDKLISFSPELYSWMIIEGYGKVLSRDGLSLLERELAIVAMLTVENRPKQLYSHILGAINAGGNISLLESIIDDIGLASKNGKMEADRILSELKEKRS